MKKSELRQLIKEELIKERRNLRYSSSKTLKKKVKMTLTNIPVVFDIIENGYTDMNIDKDKEILEKEWELLMYESPSKESIESQILVFMQKEFNDKTIKTTGGGKLMSFASGFTNIVDY